MLDTLPVWGENQGAAWWTFTAYNGIGSTVQQPKIELMPV
jgi:hypothetical protein